MTRASFRTQVEESLEELDSIVETFEALLRITQIEAGARRARFSGVELGTVLADVADIYEPVAEEAGDRLVSTVAIAERAHVTGDRELLTQLFANLIENAIRHSPKGTRIDVSLQKRGERHVAVVADSGPGIPEHERENVFRRLYRLERERTTPGSGLGLSLVAAIAELHGAGRRAQRQRSRPARRGIVSTRLRLSRKSKKVQCTRHCTKGGDRRSLRAGT